MKTLNKDHLPDDITIHNRLYLRDITRTGLHQDHKPYDKRGCILVKVMSKNLKGKTDLHSKPYKPTEWVFYCAEAAKTHKAYEEYLNAYHAEHYDFETFRDNFTYITSKNRQSPATNRALTNAYYNKKLGTLLRKYDPIAFHTGFNEWQPK